MQLAVLAILSILIPTQSWAAVRSMEKSNENQSEKSSEKTSEKDSEKTVKAPEKPPEKTPEKVLVKFSEATAMRALPGSLNEVAVFNSNSPEMVLENGILLSTFPFEQMENPECHLNFAFQGDFDLFAHHVTKAESDADERVLWLGFLVGNPSNKKVRVKVLNGATYLSQPDAPFVTLPDIALNDEGKLYAGPGDRVSDEVLRGVKPTFLPESVELEAGQTKLLVALPLPVRKLRPALNGRSLLLKLNSSGPVNVASLAKYVEREQGDAGPSEMEWIEGLNHFVLATPRDKPPTLPFTGKGGVAYGRVAGVGLGNEWTATVTDAGAPKSASPQSYLNLPSAGAAIRVKPEFSPLPGNSNGRIVSFVDLDSGARIQLSDGKLASTSPKKGVKPTAKSISKDLSIPLPGQRLSFPLSTVERGTFGTGQVQSAPLLVSYADTAYLANGNYGITYKVELPLFNPLKETVNVQVLFCTPLKTEEAKGELQYYDDPPPRAHFRGTVKVNCDGITNFWHLVQKQGFDGSKLAELEMLPGSRKKVSLEFIYPPDATPPHVLSIVTIKKAEPEN